MRVIEAFGPTIQGEGPLAGRVTHFLRLGGCDYRCSWCDSMYAVEPAEVRAAVDLTELEVAECLDQLTPAPMLVISGGNPALWELGALLGVLRDRYATIAVETQGSVWRPWLLDADSLVVSPKPPSSGMATGPHMATFWHFMTHAEWHRHVALKIVIFTETDLLWATRVARLYPSLPLYLSVGTDVDDHEHADVLVGVGERFAWLCEQVGHTPELHRAVVLPQLHVIAWGHKVGV